MKIEGKFSSIPDLVTQKILEHCQVNGAVPISAGRIQELMKELGAELLSELKSSDSADRNCSTSGALDDENGPSTARSWVWGGRIHMVPQDFRLPRCNTSIFWNLYWNGRPADRIQPYRYLNSWDLHVPADRVILSKGKAVINALVRCITESNTEVSHSLLCDMTHAQRDSIFSIAFETLIHQSGRVSAIFDAKRYGEKSITTIYDYLASALKK